MIDLFSVASDSALPRSSNGEMAATARYHRELRQADLYMLVQGDQPVDTFFYDCTEFVVICRADLLGTKSATNSAAAYIGQQYREFGDDFASRLRGSFAIIIFDRRQRRLKAWTDHFGIERVVYSQSNGSIRICTDMQLLARQSGARLEIDPAAIQEYLQYTCIPAPRTIYRGIERLRPGHRLISWPSKVERYWDMTYDERVHSGRSESEWADETKNAVCEAVGTTVGDFNGSKKLGCFLSGGTDSSSVAGFVGQLTAQPPRTFSIGFDDPRYNEIDFARIAAKRFKADHHEYFVTPSDIVELVQKAVQVYDEPFGNSSIVPTYHCARLAADNGVTHLLAGDGGDELFGGNSRYAEDRLFQRYAFIPHWSRKWLLEPAVGIGSRWTNVPTLKKASSYIRRSNIPAPDRYFSYSLISSVPHVELFSSDFLTAVRHNDPLKIARDHFKASGANSELNRWLYMDLKIIIGDNDVRKVSTMSRLAGITTRYPLLDPSLAEFSGTIPADLKVRGPNLRYLFKKAMQEVLPSEIITKTKHGFGLPYSVWLAENRQLRDFTFDILGSERCRKRGYFRSDLIDWLWPQYESVHRGYYGEIIWIFLMLEMWHLVHVDKTIGGEAGRVHAVSVN